MTARPAEPRASRRRPSRSAPLCALALLAAGWLDLAWGNEAAQALLERMSQAAHTLNYDGTFMYHKDGVMESMRIIHRAEQNGAERERLISLNGVPREVLRDSDVVRCILPDDESVVIARAGSAAVPRQPRVLGRAGGSTHYRFSAGSGERIAGRTTRTIVIEPADEYRYGYRLWLDEQTSLLLRSEVYDPGSGTLEEIVYTTIAMPQHIPDELLEPGISAEGFTIKDLTKISAPSGTSADATSWLVEDPPPGFVPGNDDPPRAKELRDVVEHLVLSDGIAAVSVFIEPLGEPGEQLLGVSRMGAVSAYGRVLGAHQVTVVGEVPPATVVRVGEAVRER